MSCYVLINWQLLEIILQLCIVCRTCHHIFLKGEIYISIVHLYIQHYMFNYSLYIIIIIINRNVLFNAVVTRMNKYIIIIIVFRYMYINYVLQLIYDNNINNIISCIILPKCSIRIWLSQ